MDMNEIFRQQRLVAYGMDIILLLVTVVSDFASFKDYTMPKRTGKAFGSARKRNKAPAEEYWEVQSLLDCRKKPDTGEYEYLIRWRNWDGDDTWEPETNLSDTVKEEAELVKSRYLEQLVQQQVDDAAESSPPKDEGVKASEEPLGKVNDKPEIPTPDDNSEVTESVRSSKLNSPPTMNSKEDSVSERPTISHPGGGDTEPQYEKIVGSGGAVASPFVTEKTPTAATAAAAAEKESRAEDSLMEAVKQPASTAAVKAKNGEPVGTKVPVAEANEATERKVPSESDLRTPSKVSAPFASETPAVAPPDESKDTAEPSHDSTVQNSGEKEWPQEATEPKTVPILREARRLHGLWTMIARDLETKVSEKHPATVQALAKLYPASEYPKLELTEHCVFCHKSFDRRFPEGCRMLHVIEKWTPSKRAGDDTYFGQCSRCSESWEASRCYMETLSQAFCFERTHTSDIKERLGLSLEYDNVDGKRRAAALKKSSLKPFDGCSKCSHDAEAQT